MMTDMWKIARGAVNKIIVFPVWSKGPIHLVAYYYTDGDAEDQL
jgi:hypothetical protein